MFIRMLKGTLIRQWNKMLIIAFTVALGASLATAMLCVVFDVGNKVNQELKTFGANISVVPKQSSILNELYNVEGGAASNAYLNENELGNIKTIFWAFNIVDYAPFADIPVHLADGTKLTLVGSWFNHHMDLPTGEQLDAGISSLRSWWDITEGEWLDEQKTEDLKSCMLGEEIASDLGLSAGDSISLTGEAKTVELKIVGIFSSGGDEDKKIFTFLDTAQLFNDSDGKVDSIEVSALTTPDNDLAVKAAKNINSLTKDEYETWYCTAYVSAICYQIQEVITDSAASAVRRVADSEGAILDKTQLLMLLITALSMVGASLGIMNLVTASVMERSIELGLMKAIGAHAGSITILVLTEITFSTIIGGAVGFAAGIGFAQIIGRSVFDSSIAFRPVIIPIVVVMVFAVTLAGSIPAIRMILRLQPAEVLHGRQ